VQADVPVAVAGATAENVGWQPKPGAAASKLAKALTKAGYEAKAADHGYAVKIFEPGGTVQRAIVWRPIGEPTPTGLGSVYLWGRTGDEFQAPDDVELADLVSRIVATLS
jgi:hypothetical protein